MERTLFDYQDDWVKLVQKANRSFSSLTRDERIWYTVQGLMDSVDNGGLISHYYNSGADRNKETLEDLDFLGFTRISALLKKINELFPNQEPSVDIHVRNDVISSWQNNQYDELLDELDNEFYRYEKELERALIKHIETKVN